MNLPHVPGLKPARQVIKTRRKISTPPTTPEHEAQFVSQLIDELMAASREAAEGDTQMSFSARGPGNGSETPRAQMAWLPSDPQLPGLKEAAEAALKIKTSRQVQTLSLEVQGTTPAEYVLFARVAWRN